MMTQNDELAGASGNEATVKEPVEAYDIKHGKYECPVTFTRTPGSVSQPTEPAPFKLGS